MRFGDIVLLLVLILISFGFLVSHSMNLNEELNQTRSQLARIQVEMQTLNAQYQALVEEKSHLMEQFSSLSGENASLQARVETLEAERLALTDQINMLQGKLAFIETANPILTWLASAPAGWAAALIVLPMVPLSLGVVYVMTNKKATNSLVRTTKSNRQRPITFQAALTREEFHLIALHRKSQGARQ